jgi:hypothetical protein
MTVEADLDGLELLLRHDKADQDKPNLYLSDMRPSQLRAPEKRQICLTQLSRGGSEQEDLTFT